MRIIVFCLLLLSGPYCVCAQKVGLLSGRVLARDVVAKNGYRAYAPMPGATAQLVTSTRDTLLMVTDRDGVFTFKQIPLGRSFLEVSFIGYTTLKDTVQIERNTILSFMQMTEDAKKIDNVVVKGKIPVVNRIGDTLVYNAAAMPTLAGDEAIRIVEQMPGAELTNGGVKIQGESIVRSYVNGKLLFGDDAMSVLNNLLASDVARIKVYDEVTDEDRRAGRTNGRKQKVIDVVTKKPLVSAMTGHFLASMGADIDRGVDGGRRLRYGAGVTSNFFSEKLLVAVNAFGNNIGRSSNRLSEILQSAGVQTGYNEDISASVVVDRFWGDRRDGSSVRGGYTYTDKASETRDVSRRSYFATESNPAWIYSDSISTDSKRYSHMAFLDVDLHGHKSKFLNGISWTNKFVYNTNADNSANSINTATEQGIDYTNTRSHNRSDGYTIEENLTWSKYNDKLLPRFLATVRISDNTDSGWRVDTLSSTQSQRVLESDGGYFAQRYEWGVAMPLIKARKSVPGEKQKLRVNMLDLMYQGDYENSRKRKLSLELGDEQRVVDPVNTMDYTYNYLSHKFTAMLGTGYVNDMMLHAFVRIEYAAPQKSDRFPVDYNYRNHFVMPTAVLQFFRSRNGVNMSSNFAITSVVPSIEQITARIDDTNPLQLRAGNSNLKAAQKYALDVNWSKTFDLSGKSLNLSAKADYMRNAVTTRSHFFAEPTSLPEWENYQTQANATLSTFENVDGNYSAQLSGFYSFRLGRWMTVRTSLYDTFGRKRYYVGDVLSTTDTYYQAVMLFLDGVILEKFRYQVSSSASYTYSTNTLRDNNRQLGWNFRSTLTYDPLKWLFAQMSYYYTEQKFYPQTREGRSAHTLSGVVGCKAYKGMLTVSLSVYDILNQGTSFNSLMSSNYVLDKWTTSFGRYWLVNVGVKFNRNKGGKAYGGSMGDGSVDRRFSSPSVR